MQFYRLQFYRFAADDVFPAPMSCSKTAKSCVSRKVNIAVKRSHTDRKKYEMLQEPLIEEVRKVIEMSEEFSLYSEFREGIMKLVRKVNRYVDRE